MFFHAAFWNERLMLTVACASTSPPGPQKTHPILPIAGYFAQVQESLLLLISICITAHLFPAKRPTRLPLRERGEWKKLWEEKLNDNHVAFINGNDGTLASVLKMNCSSCDVVISMSFSCPLVHCVDNVDCIPRLKVLRLAH